MALTSSVCLLEDRAITSGCCLHFFFFPWLSSLLNWIASVKSPLMEVTAKAVQNTECLMSMAKPASISTVVHTVKKKKKFCFILYIVACSSGIVELGSAEEQSPYYYMDVEEGIFK